MAGIIGEQLVEAMIVVAEWAYALGARGIDLLPGCWEHAVDDHWWVALNGQTKPRRCTRGPAVGPFEVLVFYDGWLAGGFDARGGAIASGESANEDTFIAAVRAATARVNAGGK
jgi:hypothetical protein